MEILSRIVPQLILIAVLTSINGFLAATEMALVSLDKNKIIALARKGNKKAKRIEKMVANPSNFLSTIQVGITLAGFFSSAYAATGISDEVALLLERVNISNSKQYAVIIITIMLSYITLVFGELVPKRIALKSPRKIAMIAVIPMIILTKVTFPFVKLLSYSTGAVVRIFGFKTKETSRTLSEEEIRILVNVGHEHGAVNETEKEIINSVFEFNDKIAKDVMTKKKDVFEIDEAITAKNLMSKINHVQFSRIPVYRGQKEQIVGILYMKDLLKAAYTYGFNQVIIKDITRDPFVTRENERIDQLFEQLVKSKNHMAILVDDDSRYTGIVTLEDLIEELVGEIYDEHDVTRENPLEN